MMTKLSILLFLVALCFAAPAAEAQIAYNQSETWGNSYSFHPRRVAVDGLGNVYVAGGMYGSLVFGDVTLTAEGSQEVFVAKFDQAGEFVWGHAIGDATGWAQEALALHVSWTGDVVIGGYFYGELPELGLVSAGVGDAFVARFDTDGNVEWARAFGDAEGQTIMGVVIDGDDNVAITGVSNGTIDFGGGPLTSVDSERDIFMAQLGPDGTHIWSHLYASAGKQMVQDISWDDAYENYVIAGNFAGSIDFGGGPLTAVGNEDIFVAMLSLDGTEVWSRSFGDPTPSVPTEETLTSAFSVVAKTGEVFIAGRFEGEMDFGGGALAAVGDYDIFIAAFDPVGGYLWSRGFGISSIATITLGLSEAGELIAAGAFAETLDFGGEPVACRGSTDVFVAEFTQTGAHVRSGSYGDAESDFVTSVAMDDGGDEFVIVGGFEGSINFGGGPHTSHGALESFFARLGSGAFLSGVSPAAPGALMLRQNQPNPFNPITEIRFELPVPGHVVLTVHDVAGRRVRTLIDAARPAGRGTATWNGYDDSGRRVASGTYLCTLDLAGARETIRMTLVK